MWGGGGDPERNFVFFIKFLIEIIILTRYNLLIQIRRLIELIIIIVLL